MKIRVIACAILLSLSPIGAFAQFAHFQMLWGFTNSTGSVGSWSSNDVCVGGTVYLQNKSLYNITDENPNGTPIPIFTGTYDIYNQVGTSPAVWIGSIPAARWPYNVIYTFNIPSTSIFNYSSGANIRIRYNGLSITSGQRDRFGYLTTRALPSVNAGVDQSICAGSQVLLTGSGASTYTWSPNGSNLSSINVSPATSTSYMLTGKIVYSGLSTASMTQTLSCSKTDAVNITVLPLPNVKGWISSYSLCSGQVLPALNAYPGTGSYTYQWLFTPIWGIDEVILPITTSNLNTTSYGFGSYTVIITNNITGCIKYLSTSIVLDPSAAQNMNATFNTNEYIDQINNTIQITATPNGTGNHNWYVYNSDINQTQGSLIASYNSTSLNITLNLSGYYLVKHTISKNPCNELKSTTMWIHHDIVGKRINKEIIDDNTKLLINEKSSFTVYPNPSVGIFTISTDVLNEGTIEIYDSRGQKVEIIKLNNEISDYTINLTNHAKGIYIVNLLSNGKIQSKKIILE